jgi:hypothetical protein
MGVNQGYLNDGTMYKACAVNLIVGATPLRVAGMIHNGSLAVYVCSNVIEGLSWSRLYGSWIYNYLCNQCLSPLKLQVRTPFMPRCTLYIAALHDFEWFGLVWFMVVNATFNSVISWRSLLLVEETGGPGESHRPVAILWQTLSVYYCISVL